MTITFVMSNNYLSVSSSGHLEFGNFSHPLGMLGFEQERALGKDAARGRGHSLAQRVGGLALVDALVGGPEASDVKRDAAKVVNSIDTSS